jgi:ATP-dependent helicase HrpA
VQKSLPDSRAWRGHQDIGAMQWLLHGNLSRHPYERLQHSRYLKAMCLVARRPCRDARQFAQMQALQQAWQRKLAAQQGNVDSRVEEFGWMLQELRVSLFAQELKTPVIVSVKRLQKMWEALG